MGLAGGAQWGKLRNVAIWPGGSGMGDKTVVEKLGLKAGQRMVLLRVPDGVAQGIGALPDGVALGLDTADSADVAVLFARDRAQLLAQLAGARAMMVDGGRLWLAYLKGRAGRQGGINRDSIAILAADFGLAAVSIIVVDADWSALRVKPV